MVLGEYLHNPTMFTTDATAQVVVTSCHAACVEGFGTAVLVFVIFALTAPSGRPQQTTSIADNYALLHRAD
jgi:glycerol uptake facilitator-like aquaporin